MREIPKSSRQTSTQWCPTMGELSLRGDLDTAQGEHSDDEITRMLLLK